ncbi:MAG TPA: hypothetical protein VMV09_07210 [Candidatus Saccharimonadales bacterium]|nr:hypothetical protein [Candidatus Saccharimonadales bacterium]
MTTLKLLYAARRLQRTERTIERAMGKADSARATLRLAASQTEDGRLDVGSYRIRVAADGEVTLTQWAMVPINQLTFPGMVPSRQEG